MATTDLPSTQGDSIVDRLARQFVIPAAVGLDIATTVIRVVTTGSQMIIPAAYVAWQAHTGPWLTLAYDLAGVVVLAGLALGTTAAAQLSMTLLYVVNKRVDAAHDIRNPKRRKFTLSKLTEQRTRVVRYIAFTCASLVLFFAGGVLDALHIGGVGWVSALADIAAPLIALFVITQTEREAGARDPNERAVATAQSVVLSSLSDIRRGEDKALNPRDAEMLKRGLDGDLQGMIDAALPLDTSEPFYTITDLCKRLGFDAGPDSAQRKQVYRAVRRARDKGETRIRQGKNGLEVPGSLIDFLLGDLLAGPRAISGQPMIALIPASSGVISMRPQDAFRTADGQRAATPI